MKLNTNQNLQMTSIDNFSKKLAQAQTLDFGTIFSESIELFKKTWLQGFLMQIFTLLVMLPIIIIFYVPFIAMIIAQQESGDTQAMNNFFTSMSVAYIICVFAAIIILGTIAVAITAAFFRIIKKLDYAEQVTTVDFFYFVKGKYLVKIFIIMLVSILIAIPSALLCYIPLIYTIVPISYLTVIYAFNPDFSVGDIINNAFKLGNKRWLITFGLLFVSYLGVFVLSMLTCGLGSLFLQPFLLHPLYLIYKHTIGFNEISAIDQIGISEE